MATISGLPKSVSAWMPPVISCTYGRVRFWYRVLIKIWAHVSIVPSTRIHRLRERISSRMKCVPARTIDSAALQTQAGSHTSRNGGCNRLSSTLGVIAGGHRRTFIIGEVYSLNSEVYSLNSEVYSLNSEVYSLNSEVYSLNSEVYSLNSEVYSLNSEVYSLISEVYSLNSEVYSLISEVYSLNSEVYSLNFKACWLNQ
jgi:outer membrane murein-binding lipoprotein Lpp